jgi:hypothetical protein
MDIKMSSESKLQIGFACLLTGGAYRSLLFCWCYRATFTELPKVTVCLLEAITSGAQGLNRKEWTKGRVICGNLRDGICLHFSLISSFCRGVHGIFALLGCYAVYKSLATDVSWQTIGPKLRGQAVQESSSTAWPWKMRQVRCPETSVTKDQSELHNSPEVRISHFSLRFRSIFH